MISQQPVPVSIAEPSNPARRPESRLRPVFDQSRNQRALVITAGYAVIIALAFYLSYEIRFDFLVPDRFAVERMQLVWVVIAIKLFTLVLARQVGTMLTYFSIPDLVRMFWAMTISSILLFIMRQIWPTAVMVPRGVLLVDYTLALGGLCAVRVATRVFRERLVPRGVKVERAHQQRVAIVGAGDAGASLAREWLNAPGRGFRPVIFFDDDPHKRGKLIHGVHVIGMPEDIEWMKPPPNVTKVVIAMPTAPAKRVAEIVQVMNRLGYKVETLPSMEELASGRVTSSRIRPVEVQDLLGRDAVDLDSGAIRRFIEGKDVMVTGAGGSIGSELCRQIAQLNPRRLLMVEQSEPSLFLIEQELKETGLGAVALPLVGDIADADRMEFIFGRHRPAIVFHAAAHKHVFMMERQPAEAFRNNVLGTRNVARAAAHHGAEAFVLISTDKAINPTSVMGATKRLAELELQHIQAGCSSTKFMAVRFGNVLGSSGSVIPIFKRQIALGGPVTVTHPEVMRYFMTIPEAVGLVLQSSVLGSGGEIFVLDMGQPVKIVDLAKQMIELSGYRVPADIEIKFTGLKPGEKLYEELQHHNEDHAPTSHPKIMRFIARSSNDGNGLNELQRMEQMIYCLESNEVKAALRRLVPEYTPHLD